MAARVQPAEEARSTQQSARLTVLWAAIVAGPLIFLLRLQLAYMLVPYACGAGSALSLHLITLVSLLLIGGAVALAWRGWRDSEGLDAEAPDSGSEAAPLARSRFLAALGLLSSALFAIVLLAQWVPVFFLAPCQRL